MGYNSDDCEMPSAMNETFIFILFEHRKIHKVCEVRCSTQEYSRSTYIQIWTTDWNKNALLQALQSCNLCISTLPKTDIAPENGPGPKFGKACPPIIHLRCYVGFREGIFVNQR